MKELLFKIEANAEGKWILRDGETTRPATRHEVLLWYEREQLINHIHIMHQPVFKELYTAFIEEFIKLHFKEKFNELISGRSATTKISQLWCRKCGTKLYVSDCDTICEECAYKEDDTEAKGTAPIP